ncbi:MAG: carbohydrate-binding protein, partial [Acidobacteria bacterium]|nr:carbohydrate-binding protein [Acidobacteriota bacterium]
MDDFELNGLDRTVGSPLNGTATEQGERIWTATADAVFGGGSGGGYLTHPAVPAGETRQVVGGVSYDPADFPGQPVLTLGGDVMISGEGWVAMGFSSSATGSYFTPGGDGQAWMLVRENGHYTVHAEGSGLHAPILDGVASDFQVNGFNRLELEYDAASGMVSAWVNSQQVVFRSWLPPDATGSGTFADRIDIRYAGFQMNLTNGGAAERMKIDGFQVEAGTVATKTQVPYLGAPVHLPGTLEAEAFDLGGHGVSYFDAEPRNTGGYRRPGSGYEGADMVLWPGASTAFVGGMSTGEVLEYAVTVPATGDYVLDLRTASAADGSQVHFEIVGFGPIGQPISIPNTGGSFGWLSSPQVVSLVADTVVLRLVVDAVGAAGFRIDQLRIEAFEPPLGAPLAAEDWVVLPFDSNTSSFTIPGDALLANDSPAGVEIVDTVCCSADLLPNGDVEFTPDGYFWTHRDNAFSYVIAHPDDDQGRTDQALVRVIAGGPLADDEVAIAECSQAGTAPPVVFSLTNDLLKGDLPVNRIAFDGIVTQPAHGQVTVDLAGGTVTFTPDNSGPDAFCLHAPDQFTYRIRLLQTPVYPPMPTTTAVGTVTLLGGNPVEAQDDFVDFPGDKVQLALSENAILGNDAPQGVMFQGPAVSSPDGLMTLWQVPGAFNLVLNDPAAFFALGADSLEYTVCLDSSTPACDTATVYVRAVAVANPDEVFAALTPATAPLVIPAADLLADDGPAGHLQLLGASGGEHGRARRVGDTVVYTPLDSFWEVGSDTIDYQVSYDADPTAPAEATVFVVAESGLEATDDALSLSTTPDSNCSGRPSLIFSAADLMANDRPGIGNRSLSHLQNATQLGGSISVITGQTYRYCPPEGWPATAPDRANYAMQVRIGDNFHHAPGKVFFFSGSAPVLTAVADSFLGRAEEDLVIPFADLLANDQGQGLLVSDFPSPPAHGTLTVGGSSVTYLPEAGFLGQDSFTYRILDADGRESDRARITVVVELATQPETFLVPNGVPGLALPKATVLANDVPSDLEVTGFSDGALGTVIDFGDA